LPYRLALPLLSPEAFCICARRASGGRRSALAPSQAERPFFSLKVGVSMGFSAGAGMGDRTLLGVADGLRVFP
jgi:hypothetical protein